MQKEGIRTDLTRLEHGNEIIGDGGDRKADVRRRIEVPRFINLEAIFRPVQSSIRETESQERDLQ